MKSAATRRHIFERTIDLVNEQGTDALTVRTIAEAAGVSPALIIQYFGSKDRLLVDVFEHANADVLDKLKARDHRQPDFDLCDAFMSVARCLVERDLKIPDLTRVAMAHAWRWDAEHEAEFTTKVAAFIGEIAPVIHYFAPELTLKQCRIFARTFFMIYTESCRVSLHYGLDEDSFLEMLRPHLMVLAEGILATGNEPPC